jgi:N-acetylglutamate synthase-like GNAT family acetyltransferase
LPSRETREYELNEASWWSKWVDETVWISKNCYVVFSKAFKEEQFYNRSGFLGVERVPELVVEAIEKEFLKRRRQAPCIVVEEGRPWDRLRASLSSRGYVVGDRMLVMESQLQAKSKSASNPEVEVTLVGSRSKGKELQEWTRTYLQAFYGDQRLNEEVNRIMRKVVKDKEVSVVLARIGQTAVGCAAMYKTAGGVAGAYCIGTDPRFRGSGVGATMLKTMRGLAESEGRRLILQTMASDAVEGFYLKQGFKLAYAKSLFVRRPKKALVEHDLPSGEAFGVMMDRGAAAGTTKPFVEVFSGFEAIEAVRRLFGPDTDAVISKLKISLDSPRGYLRVDGETGDIIINPEYLKSGHERHLYLDVIHELTHVKQFREGKELYDRRYAYFERPTEIEAYQAAVDEARRIGMDKEEIIEYLRVEWVTEEEFLRFVSMMRIDGG